jgi:putative photosynthetic complex assembly protein
MTDRVQCHANDYAPPRWALIGAGVMIVLVFAAALAGRHAEFGALRVSESPVVESRLIRIANAADFSATVTDAKDGSLIQVARAGAEEGFVWGAVNGLSYGRKQAGAALDAPYELARRADGKLTLTDTATGQKVLLNSFGKGNTAAFAKFLERKEASR